MERAFFYSDQDVVSDDLNAIENSVLKQTSSRSVAPLGTPGGVSSIYIGATGVIIKINTTIYPTSIASGYNIGDTAYIIGGNGDAIVKIQSLTPGGSVATVLLMSGGTGGYSVGTGNATSKITGHGDNNMKVDITAVSVGKLSQSGIYGSPADYLDSTKNLYCSKNSAWTIGVAPGTAIDSNGNLIILKSGQDITLNNITNLAKWDDATSGTKYIKVAYQEASGSLQSDDLGSTFYTRYTDSYQVRINGTEPNISEISLGFFTADSNGHIVGDLTDTRQYCRTITPASAVILDPVLEPTKSLGWISVEDHVLATGHATPTVTNPHGQTLSDLGYVGQDISDHERYSHTNGIVLLARDTNTLNSYKGFAYNTATPFIQFNAPVNALTLVNGTMSSGSIPILYVSTVLTDGDYWVVVNSSGIPSFVKKHLLPWDLNDPHVNQQYLLMGSASVTSSRTNISYCDMRRFFSTSPYDIRADFTEVIADSKLPMGASASIVDNMNRLRGSGKFNTLSADLLLDSSRVISGGPYQNGDGVTFVPPLFISVRASIPNSTEIVYLLVGDNGGISYPGDAVVSFSSGNAAVTVSETLSFIIPSGYFYKVSTTGFNATLSSWFEVSG